MSSATASAQDRRSSVRRHWFSDAVIAGFVATGTSTAALMLGYVIANGAGEQHEHRHFSLVRHEKPSVKTGLI